MKKNNKKGFTLVELVIVIAVIAILAAVLIPTISGVIDKAHKAAAESDASTIRTACMIMEDDNGNVYGSFDNFCAANTDIKPINKKLKIGECEIVLKSDADFIIGKILIDDPTNSYKYTEDGVWTIVYITSSNYRVIITANSIKVEKVLAMPKIESELNNDDKNSTEQPELNDYNIIAVKQDAEKLYRACLLVEDRDGNRFESFDAFCEVVYNVHTDSNIFTWSTFIDISGDKLKIGECEVELKDHTSFKIDRVTTTKEDNSEEIAYTEDHIDGAWTMFYITKNEYLVTITTHSIKVIKCAEMPTIKLAPDKIAAIKDAENLRKACLSVKEDIDGNPFNDFNYYCVAAKDVISNVDEWTIYNMYYWLSIINNTLNIGEYKIKLDDYRHFKIYLYCVSPAASYGVWTMTYKTDSGYVVAITYNKITAEKKDWVEPNDAAKGAEEPA